MADGDTPLDADEKLVRDWMLGLLRFAVTHEPADQAAALALACEIDSRHGWGGFTFFQRTGAAICRAILVRDREGNRILAEHLRRVEYLRLRQAFAAAVGIELPSSLTKARLRNQRFGLRDWRRLPGLR